MTKYEFEITMTGSAVQVSTAAIAAGAVIPGYAPVYGPTYLPACKVHFQNKATGTANIFIGGPSVTSAGLNADVNLAPGTGTNDGANMYLIESQMDLNVLQLSQFYVNGTAGTCRVAYYQS